MTAPTVDTPADDERIARLRDFVDRFGNDPSFSVSITDVAFLLSALRAARERAKIDRAVTRPFPWRVIVNGPDDAQIVCGEFGNPSTFATIAECHTEADARFIVEVCNAAALAATPEERNG